MLTRSEIMQVLRFEESLHAVRARLSLDSTTDSSATEVRDPPYKPSAPPLRRTIDPQTGQPKYQQAANYEGTREPQD